MPMKQDTLVAETLTPEEVARICHEANRGLCAALGDHSQDSWPNAREHAKDSALAGVLMHLANPAATPAFSHESWSKAKIAAGWTYGRVKDEDERKHPCLVPYEQLPKLQQAKDHLFRGIVHALAPFVAH
jgi:hypothetical protein